MAWIPVLPPDTDRATADAFATVAGRRGRVVVPRGLIFEKETYIPLDAVVRRVENVAFINLPKMVVGKMPWSEPPTRAERQEKLGPRADAVQALYRSRSPTSGGDQRPDA